MNEEAKAALSSSPIDVLMDQVLEADRFIRSSGRIAGMIHADPEDGLQAGRQGERRKTELRQIVQALSSHPDFGSAEDAIDRYLTNQVGRIAEEAAEYHKNTYFLSYPNVNDARTQAIVERTQEGLNRLRGRLERIFREYTGGGVE